VFATDLQPLSTGPAADDLWDLSAAAEAETAVSVLRAGYIYENDDLSKAGEWEGGMAAGAAGTAAFGADGGLCGWAGGESEVGGGSGGRRKEHKMHKTRFNARKRARTRHARKSEFIFHNQQQLTNNQNNYLIVAI
jgi:hypothetical protein